MQRDRNGDEARVRHSRASIHLGELLERARIHMIPCVRGRIEEVIGWNGW